MALLSSPSMGSSSPAPAPSACMQPSVRSFLREKGLSESAIERMLERCPRLGASSAEERVQPNWAFLEHDMAIPPRKLPAMVSRCPHLLVLGLYDKLVPTANCLSSLGAKPPDLAAAIVKFPRLLVHSVEEKLSPLLAFLQAAGVPEARLSKVILSCPRLISYSIELKLQPTVGFLGQLGVASGKDMGRLLTQWPHIFGYNVERRLQPTVEYLRNLGLADEHIAKIATTSPHILCREAQKVFQPNVDFLHSLGFNPRQVVALVCGHPPILISSIQRSLQPKVEYLRTHMMRTLEEVVDYPAFFSHSLSRKIHPRFLKLQARGISCSLESMLNCNRKLFFERNKSFFGSNAEFSNLLTMNPV